MNVASRELSQELSELSDWRETKYFAAKVWTRNGIGEWMVKTAYNGVLPGQIQAYDLGYLLRKLPVEIGVFDTFEYRGRLTVSPGANNWWYASYDYDKQTVQSAHSPEDAAAKLAIELFKQGVLTRGGDE